MISKSLLVYLRIPEGIDLHFPEVDVMSRRMTSVRAKDFSAYFNVVSMEIA